MRTEKSFIMKTHHGCTATVLFLVSLQVPFLVICREQQWNHQCPTACTCHDSNLSELPLYRFLHVRTSKNDYTKEIPSHFNNNVMYEDEPVKEKKNYILKTAMCVFQFGTEPHTLLHTLSADIQALTILQARDSGEIDLEAEHLSHFQELQALEIHGFYQEANNHSKNELPITSVQSETGKLVLRNDALRPLTSLKYLNLQHIKLLDNPGQGNRASPAVIPLDHFSNDISVNVGTYQTSKKVKQKAQNGNGMHRLIFLPPADGEGDILPYKVYAEQQEQAGLSMFTGLVNLEFVRVFSCGLHEINWEMFDGLFNLRFLSLEKNQLLFIPDFAFLGTPNLHTLSLAYNQLLSMQSTSLAGLFELEKLNLSHNNFSHLSELSLPPLPKLRTADFKHNPIESIFASTFEIMNATSILHIGGKESSLSIQPNSFLGLVNLKELYILNVGIPMLERELLRGMPNLKELEINGIVESLSFDAFLEVPKLENLVLQYCSIRSISMDAFYGLYGLLYLDLSNNLLESLPPGLFDQQFSLRELLLCNNNLNRLPPGFFSIIPAKMVRLDGNPWHCTCAMKDWQPAVINKVKKKSELNFCQFRYDKGSMCNHTLSTDHYIYDKKVAPQCISPPKFKNWNVFQVLRKELRCNKKQHIKMERKAYLKKKYEDYEKSIKPTYVGKTLSTKYYPQSYIQSNVNKKTRVQNSYVNTNAKSQQNSTHTSTHDIPISTMFTELMKTMPTTFIQSTINSNNKHTANVADSEITLTTTMQVSSTTSHSTLTPSRIKTQETSIQEELPHNLILDKTYITSIPKTNNTKQQIVNVSLGTNISPKNKKEKQRMDMPREVKEKATVKENMKLLEPNYMIQEENGKQIKFSKKAWKLEMERKHQEKLKRYQIHN